MTYPNSGTNKVGVAIICPVVPLVSGIKAGTSATGKHKVDIISAALLKIRVNTPIPILGQPGVIPKLYLTYS